MNVHGCLSRLSLCGPVMDWQLVQGVPQPSPNGSSDTLQPTVTLHWIKLALKMDGWMDDI